MVLSKDSALECKICKETEFSFHEIKEIYNVEKEIHEDIKNVYGIDVAGIRREIISTKEDITKLNDIKNVIKEVKRIKIDDLVELIEVNRANLLSLIIHNNDKLNVEIDGDFICPKKD